MGAVTAGLPRPGRHLHEFRTGNVVQGDFAERVRAFRKQTHGGLSLAGRRSPLIFISSARA